MPKEGQKSVTLNEAVYEKAKKRAKHEKKSVAGFIAELIEKKAKEANPT